MLAEYALIATAAAAAGLSERSDGATNGATAGPTVPASLEGYPGATPAEQIAAAAAQNQ